MRKLLHERFDEATRLSQAEQEALGRWLLDEMAAERRWDELLAGSQDTLSQLAAEALNEHRAGRTPQ